MTTKKILLILDEKFMDEFDQRVEEKGSTRTEQIRAAMQFYLKWEDKMIHPMVGSSVPPLMNYNSGTDEWLHQHAMVTKDGKAMLMTIPEIVKQWEGKKDVRQACDERDSSSDESGNRPDDFESSDSSLPAGEDNTGDDSTDEESARPEQRYEG